MKDNTYPDESTVLHQTVSISLLGPFRLVTGTSEQAHTTALTQALLAYLIAHQDQPIPLTSLAQLCWPDFTHAYAREQLQYTIQLLQHALANTPAAPGLRISAEHLQFVVVDGVEIDTEQIRACLRKCDAHPHGIVGSCAVCERSLTRAATYIHGTFLEGLQLEYRPAFNTWIAGERTRMNTTCGDVLNRLAAIRAQRGDLEEAIRLVQRSLHLDPWRNTTLQLLMRLLALSGTFTGDPEPILTMLRNQCMTLTHADGQAQRCAILHAMSNLLIQNARYAEARPLIAEGLRLASLTRDPLLLLDMLEIAAWYHERTGRVVDACELFTQIASTHAASGFAKRRALSALDDLSDSLPETVYAHIRENVRVLSALDLKAIAATQLRLLT